MIFLKLRNDLDKFYSHLYSCSQRYQPEVGHMSGRKMSVTVIKYSYIIKLK